MIRKALLFLLGLLAGATLVGVYTGKNIMKKVHYTNTPLLLSSNAANSSQTMLPVGTAMYYDASVDDGFSRYIVYVNTKVDLELSAVAEGGIASLNGRPMRKETLLRALKEHPMARQDLEKDLGSEGLSREDIKEILTRFLEAEK
jgi:hypothetical protein